MHNDRARWSQTPSGDNERLLLTPEEAADVLHVGRTTVYALIKERRLHAVHIGRSCRVSRAELQRYVTMLDEPIRPPANRRHRTRRTVTDQAELFDLDPDSPDAA